MELDTILNLKDELTLLVDGIHVLIHEVEFLPEKKDGDKYGIRVDYTIIQGEPTDKEALSDAIGMAVVNKIKQQLQQDDYISG